MAEELTAAEAFIVRANKWYGWVQPNKRVTVNQIFAQVNRHLHRLREITAVTNLHLQTWTPQVIKMSPEEIGRKIGVTSQWYHALVRAADLPANIAYSNGGEQEISDIWARTEDQVQERVWHAAAEKLVGCWKRVKTPDGGYTLKMKNGPMRHEYHEIAMKIAKHVALHHAMHAAWLYAESVLVAKGLRNPYTALTQIERWGYIPIGPDGLLTPNGEPRFVIAELQIEEERPKRRRG